jgi:SMI1 / KNR4 family (SUKH-1)
MANPWQNHPVASIEWSGVRERVSTLGAIVNAAGDLHALAWPHRYTLRPPLSASELEELHHQLGVELPIDYREFLTRVGAGGAGPLYGVFPLVNVDGQWHWKGDGADQTDLAHLAEPFPLRSSNWRTMESLEEQRPDRRSFIRADAYHEAQRAWDEQCNASVWNPQLTYGAICISDEGCGLYRWLVVSGPERGNIWIDHRLDGRGLTPEWLPGLERVTFGQWYMSWLQATTMALQHCTEK